MREATYLIRQECYTGVICIASGYFEPCQTMLSSRAIVFKAIIFKL